MQTNRRHLLVPFHVDTPLAEQVGTALDAALITAIIFYRNTMSCMVLHSCRFTPTCSVYAIEAIERHGALQGGWRTALRLLRCRPLGGWGFDPVR